MKEKKIKIQIIFVELNPKFIKLISSYKLICLILTLILGF